MKRWKILICALLVVSVSFSGGVWVGIRLDPGVDPQNHIATVFTPYDDGLSEYLRLLDRAQHSVHIAAYSFTHPAITDKLIELKEKRGVTVRVILDLSQSRNSHEQAQIERLRRAGIEVVIGKSAAYGQIMHHKYTIVDGLWVYSGSWNFSKSANKQANFLDFIGSPRRARLFLKNWQQMYDFITSKPPSP